MAADDDLNEIITVDWVSAGAGVSFVVSVEAEKKVVGCSMSNM